MHNPNSAIERVKNHLAYKLGQAMIDFSHQRNNYKYGGGYIVLFKKLYRINKQHKKEQKIYQQTIQVFPQLKYPSLETCSDYEQALRYKFHLSYMLGEVLIQTFQNLHKGSMFKLAKNIKKANKEFKIFKEIFDQLKIYDIKIHKDFIGNKCLFLEKIPRIQNILKIHQDYQPILDNIFHNFNYFIQNFDLIEEWLLSNDFDEKYKKENHPYPSLLDPKKLNDEKEKINYKNIPAELAWEMNLPLPDNYEFAYPLFGLSGGGALSSFFQKCGLNMHYDFHRSFLKSYYLNYNLFKERHRNNILYYTEWGLNTLYREKFLSLFFKKVPILLLVRDPISRLKTAVNHHTNNPDKDVRLFNLSSDFNKILNCKKYGTSIVGKFANAPMIEYLNFWFFTDRWFLYNSLLSSIKNFKVFYIDMEEIKPTKAFDTMCVLADKFGFKKPIDKKFFEGVMNGDFLGILPFTLYIHSKDIDNVYSLMKSYENLSSLKDNNGIHLQITSTNLIEFYKQSKEYINFTKEFFDKPLKYENLGIFLKPQELERLRQDSKLFDVTKRYLNNFFEALEERIELEKAKLFKEKDVLNYLKENKELRIKLKNILDKELVHIKQHRPDIVASWKYYQEFEKMCKELDQ
ncbi:DUF2972 domain-containing protein [Campylobacter jejuni]|uniref:DUF2972 domain-containing protein n=1 Tax=Campylobacter jejuni TaxID=197 RepID=UPI000F7FCE69|nr:DUF2972 domain-containing protein [Campylobacter jejuni]RTJ57632.1 capsular biosynthesis protein [Campylobacter jejuni]